MSHDGSSVVATCTLVVIVAAGDTTAELSVANHRHPSPNLLATVGVLVAPHLAETKRWCGYSCGSAVVHIWISMVDLANLMLAGVGVDHGGSSSNSNGGMIAGRVVAAGTSQAPSVLITNTRATAVIVGFTLNAMTRLES